MKHIADQLESKRKGAKSIKDIPTEILDQLNQGKIESANLVERLAVDQRLLLKNLLNQNGRTDYFKPILCSVEELKKQTVNTINEAIGTGIFQLAKQHNDQQFFKTISKHKSDLVRCWATYTIGKNQEINIDEILQQIKPFAADKHFGVREICWMSVRKRIATDLEMSIAVLSKWTSSDDENIRRFTTESTRPRGVWCEHIEMLKKNPEIALPILEPLKNDPSGYVRDSVGNWLNDASKTKADFVTALFGRWEEESKTKETNCIVKKALRTINK